MYYSPKTSTDGLVFHYDTGNTVRSYLGEPTVNLLYSAGAYNLIDGATDIYGRVTKTNLGGGKYRFVNNGTGVSTIRLYTNQSDLINGATYGCSVYFENLVGSLAIDWCDTSITGVNSSTSPSGRLYGTGTRALYDSPYYFLDVDLSTGGAVTLYDPQVEYKSHVTPFVAGTRSVTQGLKDLTAKNTIDLSNVSFDSNAQMTFDGTNDYINLGDNSLFDFTNGIMTVEAIIKFPSSWTGGSQYPNLVSKGGSAGWDTDGWSLFGFRNYGSGTGYAVGVGLRNSGTVNITLSYNQPADTWLHVVGTLDGGSVKVYVNGVLKNNTTQTVNPGDNNTNVYIGRDPSSQYFPGDIPVTKIYNRALTADEVQRNFNAVKSRFNIA